MEKNLKVVNGTCLIKYGVSREFKDIKTYRDVSIAGMFRQGYFTDLNDLRTKLNDDLRFHKVEYILNNPNHNQMGVITFREMIKDIKSGKYGDSESEIKSNIMNSNSRSCKLSSEIMYHASMVVIDRKGGLK